MSSEAEGRYSRNEALFGPSGQENIRRTSVGIVGLGGLGSHIAQQLAYLGVEMYALVDDDRVTQSSLNRLIGSLDRDIEQGTPKVRVTERLIRGIQPAASIDLIEAKVEDPRVPGMLRDVDVVFGCLDRDLPRLQLTDICSRLAKPYFDLASDTGEEAGEATYGGRIVLCDGKRCLFCLGLLDQNEIARDSLAPEHHHAHDATYGVRRTALGETGPSVVSVNGTVASLAVTEFMVQVTGLHEPAGYLNYYGERQLIRQSVDKSAGSCPYCTGLWGRGFGNPG
jgi:hypothetical protein